MILVRHPVPAARSLHGLDDMDKVEGTGPFPRIASLPPLRF
ncbi:MAG: hypothetical protein [Olavius algarvensis Gamma 1 endosymbiont]|nr:MAG: hypothetical protein [Olavius algarvensis Gamma 1 endosymbiont]